MVSSGSRNVTPSSSIVRLSSTGTERVRYTMASWVNVVAVRTTRLTRSLSAKIDPQDLVEGEVVVLCGIYNRAGDGVFGVAFDGGGGLEHGGAG